MTGAYVQRSSSIQIPGATDDRNVCAEIFIYPDALYSIGKNAVIGALTLVIITGV